jgi:hypothetical protein
MELNCEPKGSTVAGSGGIERQTCTVVLLNAEQPVRLYRLDG